MLLANARALPSFYPLINHYLSGGDDWESAECPVPHLNFEGGYRGWFGSSLVDFRWYLEDECAVETGSIEEICMWLSDCTYSSRGGAVQHPKEFERSRKGDCTDHAIWAWRKLIESGYDAEFVVGSRPNTPLNRRHAWLIFEDRGRRYVLESVCKDPGRMLVPLQRARALYSPHCSIDGNFVRRVYSGRCGLVETARIGRLARTRQKSAS